jgi:hypothetical protein
MAYSKGHARRLAETYLADILDGLTGEGGPGVEWLAGQIIDRAYHVKIIGAGADQVSAEVRKLVLRFDMDADRPPGPDPKSEI